MATGPTLALDPLELFDNTKEPREEPVISKYWLPGVFGIMGFTGTIFANWITKRPLFSGIQRHGVVTLGAIGFGFVANNYRNEYLAEKDAVIRHYIELHRDEFPPFEQKKYSEVLEKWYPIR